MKLPSWIIAGWKRFAERQRPAAPYLAGDFSPSAVEHFINSDRTALDPKAVLAGLDRLRRLDRQFKVFGAIGHKYKLNPPIVEVDVTRFEAEHRLVLPDDYRRFLLEIGNGGAGPHYGVFGLGMMDGQGSEPNEVPWAGRMIVGDLSKPFRYQSSWNLPKSFWEKEPQDDTLPQEEQDRLQEEWDQKLEPVYWSPEVMEGALPIAHQGCALRLWLVVTGPARGTLWHDDRADNDGLRPVLDVEGTPLMFAGWYARWLNDSLSEATTGKKATR